MDFFIYLKAAVLGIVEGLTEFLPVSSTGHLIIAEKLLPLGQSASFVSSFEIIIQLGAILAVILYFFKRLWPWSGSPAERGSKWGLWLRVFIAVMPAVVLGLPLDDWIDAHLFNPATVAVTLIFYGIILIALETWFSKKSNDSIFNDPSSIPLRIALFIGLFQCLSLIPGTSRAAATIIGAIALGLSRTAAAEFSFFLAIPTIAGASLLKIVKNGLGFNTLEYSLLAVGFLTSFIIALIVIKLFMEFIRRHDFRVFGYYRIILGAAVIALIAAGVL